MENFKSVQGTTFLKLPKQVETRTRYGIFVGAGPPWFTHYTTISEILSEIQQGRVLEQSVTYYFDFCSWCEIV